MAKANLKVYLDHHIERDNLLYKRVVNGTSYSEDTKQPPHLTIRDLYGQKSKARRLRKPDFQRATMMWSPEECVDLLYAVLNEQVVPSVIMWLNPDNNRQYVLDGGHRISVLLAWIKNDWGDSSIDYKDSVLEKNSRLAAQRVRDLLREKQIGNFDEYLDADDRYSELETEGRDPEVELGKTAREYAQKARRWDAVDMGFPILWVNGDYETAERSFLKINKTGRRLSEWETKLVENRSSSFARAVMSIARISEPEHCWPTQESEVINDDLLKGKATLILKRVRTLHDLLFEPSYQTPINDLRQPLLAFPFAKPEKKPEWLAELLTITEGKKGQKPETELLIQKDKNERAPQIITNGLTLVDNALDVIGNIYGNSSRSLLLMPLVYFYSPLGTYVRSLLYGFLYWINHGTDKEIRSRKLLFTVHRAAFEKVLIESKSRIIKRIGRRIGSGPEVTLQTARYFDGLLDLLIQHNNKTDSEEFKVSHITLIETLQKGKVEEEIEEEESKSRTLRGQQKATLVVSRFIEMFDLCEICGGKFYPDLFTQIDHIEEYSRGGKTAPSNSRFTHPFCNNNRKKIEELLTNEGKIKLPLFDIAETESESKQLKFIFSSDEETEFELFDDELDSQEEITEEES